MSHPVANLFNLQLAREYRIFDRKDTIKAFGLASDKTTFRDNLDAACRRAAFDKTVESVSKQFHTNDPERVLEIVSKAGLVYVPSQRTVINKNERH